MPNLNTAPAGDTAVSTFNFRGFDLRCVEIDGDPWFAAPDVCKALDLKTHPSGGYSHHFRRLEKDERVVTTKTHMNFMLVSALGNMTLVSESGLYKIIMRAHTKNPAAREFQDWVTRDVLPAIRKDGGYIEGEEKVASGDLSEDELVFKAMEVMRRKGNRCRDRRGTDQGETEVGPWGVQAMGLGQLLVQLPHGI